jgi:hypothetical protein
MEILLEILKLVFSFPGATFAICGTIIAVLLIYVRNDSRFRGVNVAYKDLLKLELPQNVPLPPVQIPPAVAVESNAPNNEKIRPAMRTIGKSPQLSRYLKLSDDKTDRG